MLSGPIYTRLMCPHSAITMCRDLPELQIVSITVLILHLVFLDLRFTFGLVFFSVIKYFRNYFVCLLIIYYTHLLINLVDGINYHFFLSFFLGNKGSSPTSLVWLMILVSPVNMRSQEKGSKHRQWLIMCYCRCVSVPHWVILPAGMNVMCIWLSHVPLWSKPST